jgi:hypothetical protein
MAKKQSFADKANKRKHAVICPVCNSESTAVKLVQAEKRGENWRFVNKPVMVCKCNEKEVFG